MVPSLTLMPATVLGDMLCAGGGCTLAIATRCSTAWGKFRKVLPILTSKHVFFLTHGKVLNDCIRSTLLHSSETWVPSAPDLPWLCRNDISMICWICGVNPYDDVHMETLYAKFGIQEEAVALRSKRLRWLGHVTHASSWINSITDINIPCSRRRKRPRKSWSDSIRTDINT